MKPSRNYLPIIFLLGLALRLFRIGHESLWADEYHSLLNATQPTLDAVAASARGQGVQAPYFILLHWLIRIIGQSDSALRLLSALCGALSIVVIHQLIAALFPGRGRLPLLCALLFCVSPMSIWYSQEARPYALQVLLELLTLLTLVQGFRRIEAQPKPGLRDGLLLVFSALLMILTLEVHNYSIFIWMTLFMLILWAGVRRIVPVKIVIPPAVILLAGLIHPFFSVWDRLTTRRFLDFLPPSYGPSLVIDVMRAQLLGPHFSPLPYWLQLGGIGLGSALMGWNLLNLLKKQAGDRLAGVVAGLGLFFTLAVPVLISFYKPIIFYGQRYLIIALPFTVILLSLSAAEQKKGLYYLKNAVLVCLIGLQLVYLANWYTYRHKHTWDTAGEYLTQHAGKADTIWVVPERNAGLLARYMPAGTRVQGLPLTDTAVQNLGKIGGQRFVICYNNLHDWLQTRCPNDSIRLALFETHQPGQTIWIHQITAAPAR